MLQSFSMYINFQDPKTWVDFLQSPLWYNHNIKVGGVTIYYKSWYDKGILFLNDLFDTDGNFFSLEKFQDTYSLQTNFLQYQGVINSVRNYLADLRFQPYPNKITLPVRSLYLCNILKDKKGCRTIYNSFVTNTHIPKSIKKYVAET